MYFTDTIQWLDGTNDWVVFQSKVGSLCNLAGSVYSVKSRHYRLPVCVCTIDEGSLMGGRHNARSLLGQGTGRGFVVP